ncbi:TonB-dependent receptor [Marinigracilibium pacificum]|uniref:TonB-dependent receptor n=1 Tax=Marinigracilibium pacificum TaxID=2729599 RepID=A0A848IY37_9BACT|nr:TonB-dependent receptor [Marinigracilibium pacificum]NMM48241.1 TonB-dependent receptor [Marinigracilibium pacificum]
MKSETIKSLIIFLLGVFLNYSHIYSQGNASIGGTVTDSKSGEPLIGVSVVLDGTTKGAVTDINGYYLIKNIEPKTYNIKASFVGFQENIQYNVIIRSAGNPDLNFQMQENVSELSEVVVKANPFVKLESTPLSIQRLSREEIAAYPGGNNDIAKVVQSLPGVSGSIAGFRNDVIIRGGAPNENVYYLDGIEIPNINHFATQGSAGGPVGLLNVSFFEGVTLTTSAFASQYDNVLSGVLQFDQRDGNMREFNGNLRISASEAALTVEGPLGKKNESGLSNTSYLVSVRRSYLQFLFKLLDLTILPDYWDYQYKITHKIDDYNELIFTGIGSVDDFKVNEPSDADPEQIASLEQVPVIKQWTTTSGLSWKRRFKDVDGFMRTTLSTNILNNEFTRYQDNINETGVIFNNNSREWETKLRYEATRFIDNWTFSTGATIQNANYTNNTSDQVYNVDYNTDLNFIKYGFFGQASVNLLQDRLGISGGFRFDGNSFTDNGNKIYKTFSPRLSATYKLDEAQKWSINASVGRYYKLPPYTVLGYTNNLNEKENQSVDYIQSDHFVAGIEYLLNDATKISIEGFYKKYDNYPVSVRDSVSLANLGGGFEVLGNEPVKSVGLGRTYGMEFLYNQKFKNNFYAIFAYTLFWSEFSGFDTDDYLPSSWDSRHLLSLTGGYKFNNNWEIGIRARYVGESPYPIADLDASVDTYPVIIYDYSTLSSNRLSSYSQIDLRVDKKWNFKKTSLNVFLEIQNILGSRSPSPATIGYDRDSEGNIIEPRKLIEIESLNDGSVLPSIGVVLDF